MPFIFWGLGLKRAFPTTIDPQNREPTSSPMYEHLACRIQGLHAYVQVASSDWTVCIFSWEWCGGQK